MKVVFTVCNVYIMLVFSVDFCFNKVFTVFSDRPHGLGVWGSREQRPLQEFGLQVPGAERAIFLYLQTAAGTNNSEPERYSGP